VAKGDDIQERLIDFASDVIQFTSRLPKTQAGKHIAGQLLRSGTSPAPNYSEARAAESSSDFVHKLKIVLKELNETNVWLKISQKSKMVNEEDIIDLYNECGELSKIINASIKTVIRKREKKFGYQ
jgi:four helix bundle protein